MEQSFQFADRAVGEQWKRARRKAIYDKIVCAITHCSVDMRSFSEITGRLALTEQRYRGLEEILIDHIRGSVGRHDDFSAAFLPRKDHLRDRWQSVDRLMLEGKLPPIKVYKVDDAYFVVDGNHRVSAARQQGMERIKAHVTEFLSPFPDGLEESVDEQFIAIEQRSFAEKVGPSGSAVTGDIRFTCAGCYRDLANQIERYRQGMSKKAGEPVSFPDAFLAWHEEIYTPAVAAMRQEKMLELFPHRTEADLFIWSWLNRQELEEGAQAAR